MTVKEDVQPPQVVALTTSAEKKTEKVIELFSIDGESYFIPVKIRPNKALQIMHAFRTGGDNAGIDYMMEVLLGTEGHEALMGFDDLEDDDFEKIVKIAFEVVSGSTPDGPKGSSKRGSRR